LNHDLFVVTGFFGFLIIWKCLVFMYLTALSVNSQFEHKDSDFKGKSNRVLFKNNKVYFSIQRNKIVLIYPVFFV